MARQAAAELDNSQQPSSRLEQSWLLEFFVNWRAGDLLPCPSEYSCSGTCQKRVQPTDQSALACKNTNQAANALAVGAVAEWAPQSYHDVSLLAWTSSGRSSGDTAHQTAEGLCHTELRVVPSTGATSAFWQILTSTARQRRLGTRHTTAVSQCPALHWAPTLLLGQTFSCLSVLHITSFSQVRYIEEQIRRRREPSSIAEVRLGGDKRTASILIQSQMLCSL